MVPIYNTRLSRKTGAELELMNECEDIAPFVNEDIDKLENRINLSILGLLNQDWFHEWLLNELGMPLNAAVYPPKNEEGGLRADFKIRNLITNETYARIEVETHFDAGQLAQYESKFSEPVKTIWGLEEHEADLSLERIKGKLISVLQDGVLKQQHRVGVCHLLLLINEALSGSPRNSKPVQVSERMKDFWLVKILQSDLGNHLDFDLSRPEPRMLFAHTYGPNGFSLRVYSEIATRKSVSILSVQFGNQISFSSIEHLQEYLPNHNEAIADWTALLGDMNCFIDRGDGRFPRGFLKQSDLETNRSRFIDCLIALCEPR